MLVKYDWYFVHNHYYYCTRDRECWFALRVELYVLRRRHYEYSWWLWSSRKSCQYEHERNDVTVSIKVKQFRSRYAKYVYYDFTRVLCECYGYKRDREPSRVSVKMLKRLIIKTNQSHRKSMILLKIMQHERKVHIKQVIKKYNKKWEGNQFLEQETLTLQWDMSTIQVEINMERSISNT